MLQQQTGNEKTVFIIFLIYKQDGELEERENLMWEQLG
jgi:hypothetical protein